MCPVSRIGRLYLQSKENWKRMLCFSGVISLLSVFLDQVFSVQSQDVVGCGGFVQSDVSIDYSLIEMKLYTKQGIVKSQTDCAPNNGYFLIPLYDKGTFVLKIDPPVGWSFDPISVELHIDGNSDQCSKGEDINFIFKGFTVSGKIVSKGRDLGPLGVEVYLQTTAVSEEERKTVTTEGGFFSFARVMPGAYKLLASHASWTFENAETEFTVTSSNVEVLNKLIVSGYDVKGHVLSNGEPIQDVSFLLFSKSVNQQVLPGCEQISSEVVEIIKKKTEVDIPLCHVKSGVDGLFAFPSVPSGEYTLVPYYQGEVITFDVIPSKLMFSVNYKSVVLKTPFQVHGFSVSGQVVSPEGQGIGDVSISIVGGPSSVTSQEGVYVLNNITAGTYFIQATKENHFFDTLKVQVTPNTPKLPVIVPSGYHLCGKLHIEEFPVGATQMKGRKIVLQTEGAPLSARSVSTSLDGNGYFCFRVAPGVHHIQPVVTSQEASSGLAITPREKVVKVTDSPILDVAFSQFRATIQGTVKCIGGSCSGVKVLLQSLAYPDQSKRPAQVIDTPHGSIFAFKHVLPGRYKATVLQDAWCWHNKSIEFKVSELDVDELQFVQSGFILKCILSHNIKLFFSLESQEEVVGSFNLTKGTNRFCLAEPGVYNLVPHSCHQFEQRVYKYNTSAPSVLTLTAVKHLLTGVIRTVYPVSDITVTIRSLETKEVTTVGPLKVAIDSRQKLEGNQESAVWNSSKSEEIKQNLWYNFSYWGRRDEDFDVAPASSQLLFYPSTQHVTISDNCPATQAEFEGRQGVFIEGHITPPLSGVEILITSSGDLSSHLNTHTEIKVKTDKQGKYRVGPLHGGVEYSVTAIKPGFIFSHVAGKSGHFQALKLGQIEIVVTDEEDQPLPAVLLSLSAGHFRSNNLTWDNGSMVFVNLGPGQYFFRPMLKEYTFSPASQMIDVAEGLTVRLPVKGKRVAFSCFGLISSLNGEPEKGIAIEAVGLDSCQSFQEETVSDQDGQYRLRGLQPGCMYRARVKEGDSNPHIERASPSFIDIQVSGSDLQKVNIIVFHHINQFDITGNVVTGHQFIPTLKVALYPENNQDSPIFTTHVGLASYFQFPLVPSDGQVYVVRLYSSLSTLNYQYSLPESTVAAIGVRAHVVLKFEPEQRKVEPEPTQGSILTLPLLILLILLAVYHNKVIPVLQQASQIMQGVPADQFQGPLDDTFRNRKKTQQIRRR